MATWANALSEHKLDIAEGGPAIVWEIANHDIIADATEDFQVNKIDCRGKSAKNINWATVINSGTGIPKLYAVWLDEDNVELAEMALTNNPTPVIGRFLKLRVKETNSAGANYSAVVRLS